MESSVLPLESCIEQFVSDLKSSLESNDSSAVGRLLYVDYQQKFLKSGMFGFYDMTLRCLRYNPVSLHRWHHDARGCEYYRVRARTIRSDAHEVCFLRYNPMVFLRYNPMVVFLRYNPMVFLRYIPMVFLRYNPMCFYDITLCVSTIYPYGVSTI
jgi:hypothetical protein